HRSHRPAPHRRQKPQSILIYGVHAVKNALENPAREITEVFATQNAANRLEHVLQPFGAICKIVSGRDLDRLAGPGAVHQGIAARITPLPAVGLDDIATKGIVVLLDQITDPHNAGAIIRTCAAFAVGAVITTSRHNPVASAITAKTASGGLEHVPLIEVTNLSRAIEALKERNFTIFGLDSEAPQNLSEMDIAPPYALVLGAEGKGLRQKTRKNCDIMARLDMPGAIKSLNVSNAAAISLYVLNEKLKGG
ncbi:MAG TPA: 23S rRNA (guanosine(2251)-2'-O)-methyltransferase RlmB, partial [Rhizobiales bacterium]|nr:23S rRNA (guanosine(2251)-2'-O)-methyltransferase RlmB [Hyphomicrobiales bacterium]